MKQKYNNFVQLVKSLYEKYKHNKKAIAIVGSIVLLLIVSFSYSIFSSFYITQEQKQLIEKTFYNNGTYTGPRIKTSLQVTNEKEQIPSNKVLLLLLKKKEELSILDKKKIETELNDSTYFLTKDQAKGITKTTVIVDSTYPEIDKWQQKVINENPYEQFTFIDSQSSQAKEILSMTDNKYITTPIFIYGDKNPNIQLEKGKSYFFPSQESQYIIHTVDINTEIVNTFKEVCPTFNLIGDNKTIDFIAIGEKGYNSFINLYDDIKLTGKNVCFIPEENRIVYLDNVYIDNTYKVVSTPGLYKKNTKEEQIDINTLSEKNRNIVNKIKLVNAVLKNKSQFYYLDITNSKLYMLDKITFK